VTLKSTSTMMITKLATSPVAAETTLAAIRISTSGLRKRRRNSMTSERSPLSRSAFGP
jgi:hypothetical protein